jgi:hypothetical protein
VCIETAIEPTPGQAIAHFNVILSAIIICFHSAELDRQQANAL